jgi:hypothetical protein
MPAGAAFGAGGRDMSQMEMRRRGYGPPEMVRDPVRDAEGLSVYRPTNIGHLREGDSKVLGRNGGGRVSPVRMGAAVSGNGEGGAGVEAMNERMLMSREAVGRDQRMEMMRLEQQVAFSLTSNMLYNL